MLYSLSMYNEKIYDYENGNFELSFRYSLCWWWYTHPVHSILQIKIPKISCYYHWDCRLCKHCSFLFVRWN